MRIVNELSDEIYRGLYKFKNGTWCFPSWRSAAGRTPFVAAVGFIQFVLAAFTLTVHINALYNERVHGKEEHATSINTIPLKISHLFGCFLCRIDEVNASRSRFYARIVVKA